MFLSFVYLCLLAETVKIKQEGPILPATEWIINTLNGHTAQVVIPSNACICDLYKEVYKTLQINSFTLVEGNSVLTEKSFAYIQNSAHPPILTLIAVNGFEHLSHQTYQSECSSLFVNGMACLFEDFQASMSIDSEQEDFIMTVSRKDDRFLVIVHGNSHLCPTRRVIPIDDNGSIRIFVNASEAKAMVPHQCGFDEHFVKVTGISIVAGGPFDIHWCGWKPYVIPL